MGGGCRHPDVARSSTRHGINRTSPVSQTAASLVSLFANVTVLADPDGGRIVGPMRRWMLAWLIVVAAASLAGYAFARQSSARKVSETRHGWTSYAPLALAHGSRASVAPPLPSPPKSLAARRLSSSGPKPLRPGTILPQGDLGIRVFADRRHGFALATRLAAGVQTYPVDSSDGGQTWRVAGPILHIDAAQGAIAVDQAGVQGPRFYYAWDSGYNTVVDVTTDAGRLWWQASLPGAVLSVTPQTGGRGVLNALVEGPTSDPQGRGASLWTYQTTDGRHWRYLGSLNAVS